MLKYINSVAFIKDLSSLQLVVLLLLSLVIIFMTLGFIVARLHAVITYNKGKCHCGGSWVKLEDTLEPTYCCDICKETWATSYKVGKK